MLTHVNFMFLVCVFIYIDMHCIVVYMPYLCNIYTLYIVELRDRIETTFLVERDKI